MKDILSPPEGIRHQRLARANELLKAIATFGRHFFAHNGKVSQLRFGSGGHIFFVDAYSGASIYTHCEWGRWAGFSEGGTLRALVIALRKYIQSGQRVEGLGPWPAWYSDGDPWGYGQDMEIIRGVAKALGMAGEQVQP